MENNASPERWRCIAVAGPTAAGKSAAAMALAREIGAEIVSVDSAQVYIGMDVGTAKPTPQERIDVPHHLIGIRDPAQPYSAAQFVHDARTAIQDINGRGKVALLVGGTMLYFKALFEGLDEMPAADAAVREAIGAEAAERGWPAMHAELAQVDGETAARLGPQDAQRIQRALEVYRVSGQPMSALHATKTIAENPGWERCAGLFSFEPRDRQWLHERIGARFDVMLVMGLLQEVRGFHARGDLTAMTPAMRAVGYRQAWQALDGEFPIEELRERGVAATRQLARRQLTWLRGMPRRIVLPADAPDAIDQFLQQARTLSLA